MNAIEYAARRVRDEIGDAEEYAKKAIEYCDSFPELADTLESISAQELEHAKKIYASVKGGDGREILDYEYGYLKDAERKVKALWEEYKEG